MAVGKKGTGKEQRDNDYVSFNWSNTGADLLWSCMFGKGSSAPKEKPITYLKNVNRIPGALIQSNPGETRQFFRHYSAHKYASLDLNLIAHQHHTQAVHGLQISSAYSL